MDQSIYSTRFVAIQKQRSVALPIYFRIISLIYVFKYVHTIHYGFVFYT